MEKWSVPRYKVGIKILFLFKIAEHVGIGYAIR